MTDPSPAANFEPVGQPHDASDSSSRRAADRRDQLERFFRQHHDFAYRQAFFATRGDTPLSEDLVQIVMLIIYKSHGRDSMGELLHDPDRARAYLATLIRRQVIDMWRRDRNRMVPTSPEQLTLYQDLYGEAAVSAADIANTRDLRDRVRQLPYRQREVLLRVVAGLTLPEIAEDLNLSLPAVRSILKRSRENVRSLIDTLDAETEQDMETELIAEDVLGQQNSAEFWKVLDRDLTHTEFRVAYLSWYSNQSPLEIAKTLGMTVRAVRRYQMNARRKITGMVDRHELALAD